MKLMPRHRLGCLLVAAIAMWGGDDVQAQTERIELHGTVRDDLAMPVTGASVSLTDSQRRTQSSVTDTAGGYGFRDLVPGKYEVTVSMPGFAPAIRAVDVPPRGRVVVDFTLRVAISERVDVVSSLDEIRRITGLGPTGLTLGPEQLATLPNDPDSLLQLLRELSAVSGRADQVTVYVDGQPLATRLPPKAAIQSIRISTNPFAPEFAEPLAGFVEVVTKPATTAYRADVQGTFNDRSLNARNAFEREQAPNRTQSYTAYLGGPIVPNRWSFLAYGGRWSRDERLVVNTTVVDPGTFALQPFLQGVATPSRINSFSLRSDVAVSRRNIVSLELARQDDSARNESLQSGLDLPERGTNRHTVDNIFRTALVSAFGQRGGSELRLRARDDSFHQAAVTGAPAVIVLDAFNRGGNQDLLKQNRITREFSMAEIFSLTTGSHAARFGFSANLAPVDEERLRNTGGTFVFGADTDPTGSMVTTPLERYRRTLAGVPAYSPSFFSIAQGELDIHFTDWQVSWFGQDDWRVSPSVTLSFGLRRDLQKQAQRSLSLAPRVGLAWSPNGSPSHTVRVAGGLFYSRIPSDITLDTMRFDGVHVVELIVDRPGFFPTVPSSFNATPGLPTVRVADTLRAPRTSSLSTSYEWTLTKSLFASVGYTYRRGEWLLRTRNVNAPDPANGLRPRMDRGPILQFESTGLSRSQELRATIRRALARFTMFGTYAFGISRSDTDGPYTIAADARTLQGEYGRAADDERHRLLFGSSIELPFSISLSGLLTVTSGRPFNITSGSDNDGDFLFLDRPGMGSPGGAGVIATRFGNFDVLRSPVEPMIRRNAGQGPSEFLLNAGIARKFHVGLTPDGAERYVIISASAENVTNRINYVDFNGVVTSPLFGIANRALNPRRVELSARFGF